jgi:hypothetical protein
MAVAVRWHARSQRCCSVMEAICCRVRSWLCRCRFIEADGAPAGSIKRRNWHGISAFLCATPCAAFAPHVRRPICRPVDGTPTCVEPSRWRAARACAARASCSWMMSARLVRRWRRARESCARRVRATCGRLPQRESRLDRRDDVGRNLEFRTLAVDPQPRGIPRLAPVAVADAR